MICITVLAISFKDTKLLWWFLLTPFLGYSYKETPVQEGGEPK